MKLEKQVCERKLAESLKELGLKQESLWYWHKDGGRLVQAHKRLELTTNGQKIWWQWVSAFSVAELGMMITDRLDCTWSSFPTLDRTSRLTRWNCGYFAKPFLKQANNEANARAKLLIYLVENRFKIITKEEDK